MPEIWVDEAADCTKLLAAPEPAPFTVMLSASDVADGVAGAGTACADAGAAKRRLAEAMAGPIRNPAMRRWVRILVPAS